MREYYWTEAEDQSYHDNYLCFLVPPEVHAKKSEYLGWCVSHEKPRGRKLCLACRALREKLKKMPAIEAVAKYSETV